MKKRISLAIAIFLFVAFSDIFAQKIDFVEIKSEEDWKGVIARAENLNKPVFLDIYATWCGPCKQMDNLVFSDSEVGQFYNENFINSKIDGESEYGMALVRKYGLRGYPTMYYIGYDDFMYTKLVGFRPADAFLEYGKKVNENKEQLREYAEDFENGMLIGEQVKKYVDLLTEMDVTDKLEELSDLYINNLTEEDLRNPENRGLILNSNLTFKSEQFQIILGEPDKFSEIWGEENFNDFLEKVYQEALHRAAINEDIALRDQLGDELMAVYFREDPESVIYGKFLNKKLYHAVTENWSGYINEIETYYLAEKEGDPDFLTQEVYQILRNQYSSDELLVSASGWIDTVLETRDAFEPYYLGSIIKIYLNDIEGAKEMIEKAEAHASEDEMDTILSIKRHIQDSSPGQ